MMPVPLQREAIEMDLKRYRKVLQTGSEIGFGVHSRNSGLIEGLLAMRLSRDALHKIEGFVRGGFEKRDRIIEIICQEIYAPGELDEAEVAAAVDAAFASLASDQTTWPATTDLRSARRRLRRA
jgi:hypothetical protein